MLEETGRVRTGLRRYSLANGPGTCPAMPGDFSYHNAVRYLGDCPLIWVSKERRGSHWVDDRKGLGLHGIPALAYPPKTDPRWPLHCGCGYEFGPDDEWQEWSELLWKRADTGELTTIRDAPDGAMWDAWWMSSKGPDGRSLVVKCPGGHEWMIDGGSSNCEIAAQVKQALDTHGRHSPEHAAARVLLNGHHCWVRNGEPPLVTAHPSIQTVNYHGFLVSGEFQP